MLGAVPPILAETAAIVGALALIVTSLAVLSRVRLVRWGWRHLVSDPLREWSADTIGRAITKFHAEEIAPQIEAIRKELTTNDGSTLRDEVVATRQLAEKALGYAEWAAERQGLPPGVDPLEFGRAGR